MTRRSQLDMDPDEFRAAGHRLVDQIAEYYSSLPGRPVTAGESPAQVRAILGNALLPQDPEDNNGIIEDAWRLLVQHSLHNGHPRFAGYVTSSAAPIGALADFMSAAVNPNVGAWILGPIGAEIEAQSIRWIAEFLGYPTDCGGILVSGGNMANFIGFLAARTHACRAMRTDGTAGAKLVAYATRETHTWVQKAADLFGLGTNALRWIATDSRQRMDPAALAAQLEMDRANGGEPFLIVASAGTVSTGAVDPIRALADVARREHLWLHIDGAYGAPAAALPDADPDLRSLHLADSLAVDPHKWFYAPLEAGCALVRKAQHLPDTFDYSPEYYRFDADAKDTPINYYQHGPQNSRGLRALKVWMGLRVTGRQGLVQTIAEDVALARQLFDEVKKHADLEALTTSLSITTFRYSPPGAADLNDLNLRLLDRIQKSGELFLSNAVIDGRFALRACIVNFRTQPADIQAIPEIVLRLGAELLS
jgi:glutamate/tyrosine decarboxylase-like PLP-dependent enzyme